MGQKWVYNSSPDFFFTVAASQMRFGTSYSDTLNFLYLEFHAFKSNLESPGRSKVRGPSGVVVEIVQRFLFRGFCGNLESHDEMLL